MSVKVQVLLFIYEVEVLSLHAFVSQVLMSQRGEQVLAIGVLGLPVASVSKCLKLHVNLVHLSCLLIRHLNPYRPLQQGTHHARLFPDVS